jgi:D-glycero-D-manno-heptose 1,7-bisphosphate phosphatase
MTIIVSVKNMHSFQPGRTAAFIDRDGVINVEKGYVHRIEDFEFLPGAIEGLKLLQAIGYKLVVVTNQAGIARGKYSEAEYQRLTSHMRHLLNDAGVSLSGVYHCPHHPTAGLGELGQQCDCRKPKPGMLLLAASELDLDLKSSVLVGDKESDIEAGRAAGVSACVLVCSGHTPTTGAVEMADACEGDLLSAAKWLVAVSRLAQQSG